jgi:hypothetical protein
LKIASADVLLALKPSLLAQLPTMPLKSDIYVDASKFDESLQSEKTKLFNEKLIQIWKDGPRWYEV